MASLLGTLRLEKEAWLRFLAAVVGLALAFTAAVFSTVTRQAGQLWATAVLASFALLLAGAVAVTSVPYLARRVALHRVRDAFDYQITREGLVYLVLILLISIAALNTGNNLLFIVVSAMLAAIMISGAASAVMLRGLSLQAGLPQHVFAGDRILARLSLHNTRKLLPAFSVTVGPPASKADIRYRWERSIFTLPKKNEPVAKHWIRLPDLALKRVQQTSAQSSIFSQPEYFPFLPAESAVPRDVELLFPRRGCYVQNEFGIRSRFPFSFLVKTRRIPFPASANGDEPASAAGSQAW